MVMCIKLKNLILCPAFLSFASMPRRLGYKLIIATNQSGIGRGYYSENDFLKLADWMKAQFAENQCEIDGLYYSPYHPEKAQPPYLKKSDCRKPAPGMLLQAIKDFDLKPSDCIMIGDNETDIQASKAAGIGRSVLLDTVNKSNSGAESEADEVWQALSEGLAKI
jgi:D-glycero-D-manno-heptose 1,7-bisphosphate phosphatase